MQSLRFGNRLVTSSHTTRYVIIPSVLVKRTPDFKYIRLVFRASVSLQRYIHYRGNYCWIASNQKRPWYRATVTTIFYNETKYQQMIHVSVLKLVLYCGILICTDIRNQQSEGRLFWLKQDQNKLRELGMIIMRSWASYQIRNIAGCACAGNAGTVSPRRRLQRKPLVSDPGMHHGTCVTHVPWCMSGSLTRASEENVPGTPGARAPTV